MKLSHFNTSPTRKVFFGSDFHLSHVKDFIWGPRGFTSFQEHTKSIINSVNDKVGENDILFYLGDWSLNSTPEETKGYFRALKCKNIYLLWGNHESNTLAIYKEALGTQGNHFGYEVYPYKWENVTFLGHYAMITVDKQLIVLSHFAFAIWDMMQHGAWNLCGHSHGNAAIINPDFKGSKVLDVGVDNALKQTGDVVFDFTEIKPIMDSKSIALIDHHNKNTT